MSLSWTISIKAVNGKYVSAENAGNGYLVANRDSVGSWEKFELSLNAVSTGFETNRVTIKSKVNSKYVSYKANEENRLKADSDSVGSDQTFYIQWIAPNKATLSPFSNYNNAVSYKTGESLQLRANRTTIGAWEKFEISVVED